MARSSRSCRCRHRPSLHAAPRVTDPRRGSAQPEAGTTTDTSVVSAMSPRSGSKGRCRFRRHDLSKGRHPPWNFCMTLPTSSLLDRAGLDRARINRIVTRGLEGADDGELYLEYRQSEVLVYDNGRFKQVTYDMA